MVSYLLRVVRLLSLVELVASLGPMLGCSIVIGVSDFAVIMIIFNDYPAELLWLDTYLLAWY